MLVADTGALIALLDRRDRHHQLLRDLYAEHPERWIVPWAVLPEVDYLVATRLGADVQAMWLADLADGAFLVEWGRPADVVRANALRAQYAALQIGLVDGVALAIAERLRADLATLDLRHFGAVALAHEPRIFPRDLGRAVAADAAPSPRSAGRKDRRPRYRSQ